MIGFFLSIYTYPIFATHLNIEEFAAFNYFNNYSGFFGFIFSLNLYVYYSSVFFKLQPTQAKALLKTLMFFLLIWNLIIVFVIFILSEWLLTEIVLVKFDIKLYLIYSIASVSVASIRSVLFIKLRLEKKAFIFFILSVFIKIITILSSLYYVIYINSTAAGRFHGLLFAEALSSLIITIYVFRDMDFKLMVVDYKAIFKFIWPLLISSVVFYPIAGIDQLILEKYVSNSELGFYSVGLSFAGYLFALNISIYQTFEPDLIKAKAENDIYLLKKIIFRLLAISIITTIIYCISSKFVIQLMSNGKFTESYQISNILAISYFFVLIFTLGNTILSTEGRSKAVLFNNFIGLICITLFSYILIDYKAIGVAWARVLAFAFISFLGFYLIKSKVKKDIGS